MTTDHRYGAEAIRAIAPPPELTARFTNDKGYFVSESMVYRLLKAHDLITSSVFMMVKAADEFHRKTSRPNEM